MLAVVSGQMVVHSESVKARITTLPRNALSETGCPNWLVSRKAGRRDPLIAVPGSRFGLAAAEFCGRHHGLAAGLAAAGRGWARLVPQAARAAAAASAPRRRGPEQRGRALCTFVAHGQPSCHPAPAGRRARGSIPAGQPPSDWMTVPVRLGLVAASTTAAATSSAVAIRRAGRACAAWSK